MSAGLVAPSAAMTDDASYALRLACARGRLNRATTALEAAKVALNIAKREHREASDDLKKVKVGTVLA